MNQKQLLALIVALAFILGSFVGFQVRGWGHRPDTGPEPADVKRDTVWLHDTTKIQLPAPKAEKIRDTCWLEAAVPDPERDTIYVQVPVPITSRRYAEEGWEAWVSGYRPSLDSLHFDKSTAVVEVPVYKTVTRRTRWGIGVQAGATYQPDFTTGQGKVQPYVGLGISYNIITF